MDAETEASRRVVVGREAELAAGLGAVADASVAGVVVSGDPGIGKTTLLRELVERAPADLVLRARAAEVERSLPFGALTDLFGALEEEAFGELPPLLRGQLEAALLRRSVEGIQSDWRGLGEAILMLLRSLGSQGDVVVALDDAQWIDPDSANALLYAFRRIADGDGVTAILTTRREGSYLTGELETVRRDDLAAIRLDPFGLEDLRKIVEERTGIALPLPWLEHIHRSSGGNPFYAVEIARELDTASIAVGSPPRLPRSLDTVVRDRLDALGDPCLEVLLVVALSARATPTLVTEALADASRASEGLAEAIAAEILEEDGDLRFTHPLFRAAIVGETTTQQRAPLHARLAEIATDIEEKGRHLALAHEGPDEAVAAVLEEAAAAAATRGAPRGAAELMELARRLTPADQLDSMRRRTLAASDHLAAAGDLPHALELVEDWQRDHPDELEVLMRLMQRSQDTNAALAAATSALSVAAPGTLDEARVRLDAYFLSTLAGMDEDAQKHLDRAARIAEELDDDTLRHAVLSRMGWRLALVGDPDTDEILEKACAGVDLATSDSFYNEPTTVRGLALMWHDRLEEARNVLSDLTKQAAAIGDGQSRSELLYHEAEGAWRAGDWDECLRLAGLGHELSLQRGEEMGLGAYLYLRSFVLAARGVLDEAHTEAERGLEMSRTTGDLIFQVENLTALGFACICKGDERGALVYLEDLPELALETGVANPAAYYFSSDLTDCLIAAGRTEEADEMLDDQLERVQRWVSPRTEGQLRRSRALSMSSVGDVQSALQEIDLAESLHRPTEQTFEIGRTLLVKGALLRRAKAKTDARSTLAEAVDVFRSLGALPWVSKAEAEAARIGGRSASPTELTPTELQIAEQVAQGLTNKETADRLYVSVKTVEANLSRIYRKLGVRSRAELAREFLERARS